MAPIRNIVISSHYRKCLDDNCTVVFITNLCYLYFIHNILACGKIVNKPTVAQKPRWCIEMYFKYIRYSNFRILLLP